MKKEAQLRLIVISVLTVILMIPMGMLYITYKNARALSHDNLMANKHCDDCYHVKTRLSYDQVYDPPLFWRLPHWQTTHACNTSSPQHGGIHYVYMQDAWGYEPD